MELFSIRIQRTFQLVSTVILVLIRFLGLYLWHEKRKPTSTIRN